MKVFLPALVLVLALGGAGCLVFGVLIEFGAGWALIASAPCLLAASIIAATGMTRNG
jgi:hypothetical protein